MAKHVGFRHFKESNPEQLMQAMQDWVNGGTDNVDWISEFHIIEGQDKKWYGFVKYIEYLA